MIAYGLFMLPVFHMAEKAFGVHEKGTYLQVMAGQVELGRHIFARKYAIH